MNYRIISVQFKNKSKEFVGKSYDFLLNAEEETPKRGDIIRLMDNNDSWLFYGTRVRVEDVVIVSSAPELQTVKFVESQL